MSLLTIALIPCLIAQSPTGFLDKILDGGFISVASILGKADT